jgi:hypothetical protein
VLYALVHAHGPVTGQELHRRYEAVADRVYRDRSLVPIGKRARRNKLRKLLEYDLVEAIGPDSHREYNPTDASIDPPIAGVVSPVQ